MLLTSNNATKLSLTASLIASECIFKYILVFGLGRKCQATKVLEELASSGFLRRLPLPKDQVSDQRNPFFVGRKYESKNNRDLDDLAEYDLWNCFEHGQHRL